MSYFPCVETGFVQTQHAIVLQLPPPLSLDPHFSAPSQPTLLLTRSSAALLRDLMGLEVASHVMGASQV